MASELTSDRLRTVLNYDSDSGIFTRIYCKKGPSKVGDIAGAKHSAGYVNIRVDMRRYFAHRLAWMYVHDCWPDGHIDHINGIRNDNRISNLRDVSISTNLQNTTVAHRNNTSGLLGVSARQDGYEARISTNGSTKYLGRFETPQLAHEAYLSAKAVLHPHSFIAGL